MLSSADIDNASANYIIFTIRDTKLFVYVVTLSAKENQKQIFSAKGLKGQCISMNIKQKMRIKIRQTIIDIFLNQTLLKLTYRLCSSIWIEATM